MAVWDLYPCLGRVVNELSNPILVLCVQVPASRFTPPNGVKIEPNHEPERRRLVFSGARDERVAPALFSTRQP